MFGFGVTLREVENAIAVSSPFRTKFIEDMHSIGAKWDRDAKAWIVPKEKEALLERSLTLNYGWFDHEDDGLDMLAIRFNAEDFQCANHIKIGNLLVAWRNYPNGKVILANNFYLDEKGGFLSEARTPEGDLPLIGIIPGTVIYGAVSRDFILSLPDSIQSKITQSDLHKNRLAEAMEMKEQLDEQIRRLQKKAHKLGRRIDKYKQQEQQRNIERD